jgi:hypothetical protein
MPQMGYQTISAIRDRSLSDSAMTPFGIWLLFGFEREAVIRLIGREDRLY